jgi:hypothetical protein
MEDTMEATSELTRRHDNLDVRARIRVHGEIIRNPEGFPEREVFRSLAYVYTAYAMGSRTALEELEAHLRRYRRAERPSPEMALGMARGFWRMAEGRA